MKPEPADSQPWSELFDPVSPETGLIQQAPWMSVVWPAFLAAAVLEMVIFGSVDPEQIHWLSAGGEDPAMSRGLVYTVAFFVFWLICMGCAALTLVLATPKSQGVSKPAG